VTSAVGASEACCIWCGARLGNASDAASFLFLARKDGGFTSSPEHWQDESEHLEGHQFFCHAACFERSVPDKMQPLLQLALNDE
jgi:hypothetical protein